MKRLLLAFVVVGGCTCELGDPPPSTDTPPPIPPGCGRLALPTCWDDCCTRSSGPFVDEETCEATCSGDTRPFFDACVPQPWCLDGGTDPCWGPDAGPPPACLSGDCCDAMVSARFDRTTCSYECPPGSSFECRADPVACSDDYRVCAEPSECVVVPNTCCGECGDPTLEGSTAVNRARASEHRDELCAEAGVCPECETGWNASLIATCNAARCAAVEISRLPLVACTTDDDCVMRTRDCCECGGATSIDSLIALRPDGLIDYLGLVCDTGAICDDCVPAYPDDVHAACVSGVCEVVFGADAGG